MTAVIETKEKVATPELKAINAEVQLGADKLRNENILVFENDGTNIQKGNIYIDMAKDEGLDEEVLKKVSVFNSKFAAVAGLAVGMGAIPIYEENKELESVSVTFPMTGRDRLVVNSKRHVFAPNPADRSKPVEVFGGITAVMETSLGNKNSGLFSAVSQNVRAAAAAALRDL